MGGEEGNTQGVSQTRDDLFFGKDALKKVVRTSRGLNWAEPGHSPGGQSQDIPSYNQASGFLYWLARQ